ncbi:ribosomal protein S18-alanine N-acetyltransferase [Fusobacterium russii]|uniref:ribosomal protein S18-alanine N-acetyltransferase n=1 Tax=Fusobacterium russii TaxID=854 RepID=UPI00039C7DA1|nr:ribosomal protein S18-alanine N-acetyltransferase [Fusobacterium russii]
MNFVINKNFIQTEDELKKLENLEKIIFKENPYSYKTLLEIIRNYGSYSIFSCSLDNELIAYMIVLDNIDYFEIIKIGVLEEYRNRGIAQSLLENIKEKAIFLEVRQSNITAMNFYLKNGFRKISERKNYYKDNNEDAIVMKMEVGNE